LIRGVRGATTVLENSDPAIRQEVVRLLEALLVQNDLNPLDFVSVFFTLTPDVTQASPPQIARTELGWHDVPMICMQEADIDGLPPRCIRVLIQFETAKSQQEIRHIYLNEAAKLRPDIAGS
jgi:chorismate mutase